MVKQPKEKVAPDEETDDVIRAVADRLSAARKQRGLTQAQVGEMAELSQQRIFDLEQGTANVTVRTLVRMAKVLDLDVASLFSGIGADSSAQLAEAFSEWTRALKEREAQDQVFGAKIESILDRTSKLILRGAESGEASKSASPSAPRGSTKRH